MPTTGGGVASASAPAAGGGEARFRDAIDASLFVSLLSTLSGPSMAIWCRMSHTFCWDGLASSPWRLFWLCARARLSRELYWTGRASSMEPYHTAQGASPYVPLITHTSSPR
eukprot:2556585-Prymnesium_polylepis.3